MDNHPLVSVIMSCYNEAKYVSAAIKSILNQSYSNIEFIIIDDASTDNTKDEVLAFSDPRIVFIQNQLNCKLAKNLNKAISISNGQFIARMDADDISEKRRIETQVNYLINHPEIDVVGCFAKEFGSSKKKLRFPKYQKEIKASLVFKNVLCHPSIMFRKTSIDFEYDESLSAGQDYELWSRIIWKKTFATIPSYLLRYRIHENQTRNINGQKQKVGAMIARHNMLQHLIEYDSSIYFRFDSLFDYSLYRDEEELLSIEKLLLSILERNNQTKIFDEYSFKKVVAAAFLDCWYISLRANKRNRKFIKNSFFYRNYKKTSLAYKVKAFLKTIV